MAKYSDKVMGKEVGQAKVYAPPHTGSKAVSIKGDGAMSDPAHKASVQMKPDWTPLSGVSIGFNDEVKTSGIKMRGTGAATKGLMSRGPMA